VEGYKVYGVGFRVSSFWGGGVCLGRRGSIQSPASPADLIRTSIPQEYDSP